MELSVTGPGEPAHRGTDLLPQRAGRPDRRWSAAGASGYAMALRVVRDRSTPIRQSDRRTGEERQDSLTSTPSRTARISMRAPATRRLHVPDASGAPELGHLHLRPRCQYRNRTV